MSRIGMARMLYYDRDPEWREGTEWHFSSTGTVGVTVVDTFEGAIALLRTTEFDAVVADPVDNEFLPSFRSSG